MTNLHFHHLNLEWNADPNCCDPEVTVVGSTVVVTFPSRAYPLRADGFLVFNNCSSWMLSTINDHAFFLGQCRYRVQAPVERRAPQWGEFYQIAGDDPLAHEGGDWQHIAPQTSTNNHYMFYMRDDTFECFADDWAYYEEERAGQYEEERASQDLVHKNGIFVSLFSKLKQVFQKSN